MILAYTAFAWLLGIGAAAVSGGNALAVLGAATLLAAAVFITRPQPTTLALLPLLFALVLLAGWRYDSTRPSDSPTGVALHNDGDALRLRGVVSAEPDESGRSLRYRLDVRQVLAPDAGWQPESGSVLMTAAAFPRYQYGDLLEVEGELKTPPTFDDFDYRDYLQQRGIGSLMPYPKIHLMSHGHGNPIEAALIDLRQRLDNALSDVLPQPQAALASGILVGQRGAIPADLRDAMNQTGTSHLVAVSGQNVSLLAAMVMALLAWLIGRRPAAWAALAAIIGYAMLVGGQPPVLRAAIMGGIWVLGTIAGRPSGASRALLLAAAVMLAFDPQLAKDVSFQLSFAATAGLMTLAPLLRERLEERLSVNPGEPSPLRPAIEMTAVTLSAIAFTLPIIAVDFHRISLVAPLANLFAVPAFVAVAVTSGVAATLAALLPPFAGPLAWLAWPPAAYMTTVVQLFARLPAASLTVEGFGIGHAVAYGLALAGVTWALSRRRPQPVVAAPTRRAALRPWPVPAIGVALLLALAGTAGWLALTAPTEGRLSVTFLDVGQGDSILVRTPAGQTILIDGGPSGEAALAALGRNLAFHDRDIDLVLLTNPQAEHLTGLIEVLGRYDVHAVLAAPLVADSATYRAWMSAIEAEGAPFGDATAGLQVPLGQGALLQVLNPPLGPLANPDDLNENALVLRLTMGGFSLLLTSNIDEPGEHAVLDQSPYLASTVLQLPHHGSSSAADPSFIDAISPAFAVVSVGRNSYGQPAAEALALLASRPVYRTDVNGDVTIRTDGQRLWIKTQRKSR